VTPENFSLGALASPPMFISSSSSCACSDVLLEATVDAKLGTKLILWSLNEATSTKLVLFGTFQPSGVSAAPLSSWIFARIACTTLTSCVSCSSAGFLWKYGSSSSFSGHRNYCEYKSIFNTLNKPTSLQKKNSYVNISSLPWCLSSLVSHDSTLPLHQIPRLIATRN